MLFIQLAAVHGSFLPCGLGVSQVQCAGYKYTATCELRTALGGCEMRFDLMWNLYGAMTSQTWNSFMLMKEEDRTALVHIIAKEEHQLQPSRGSSFLQRQMVVGAGEVGTRICTKTRAWQWTIYLPSLSWQMFQENKIPKIKTKQWPIYNYHCN